MMERVAMVPAERMPARTEAAGLPPSAATRTVYPVLASNPPVLNVVSAQIMMLIRKDFLPHRLRGLIIMLRNPRGSLEDSVTVWLPDGACPAKAEG